MARQLRIEFPGAIYHVTARGDRQEPIFEDDQDRSTLLDVVANAMERFDAAALSYCLMGNHYHFVILTREANLSRLMRQINSVYTQRFNRRHGKTGHLFQGRFKAILVDRDAYLLEVCRYVELNPVRAGLVEHPGSWRWSSYLALTGQVAAPPWLDLAGLHGHLLGESATTIEHQRQAAKRYTELAFSAKDAPLWTRGLRKQIYLGDDSFVAAMQSKARAQLLNTADVPKAQRTEPSAIDDWLRDAKTRNEGIHAAYRRGGYSMSEIARVLGLSVSRVSRLIAAREGAKGKT